MKCDLCDNEATVHDLSIRNGVKIERHLCEGCASQQGLAAPGASPLAEMLKAALVVPTAAAPGSVPAKATVCPECRMTFAEFKQHGLLGCSNCYKVFEPQLGPLIERAHDGGIRHVGKVPRRATAEASGASVPTPVQQHVLDLERRGQRLASLRRELENAVQAEQYELAARLRDEMRRLQESGQNPKQT